MPSPRPAHPTPLPRTARLPMVYRQTEARRPGSDAAPDIRTEHGESTGVMHGDDLRYTLLGPVKVLGGAGESIRVSPQQRAILAMLIARRGRAVTIDDLVHGVWGPSAPERARSILQSQVFELRRKLEPGRPPRTAAKVLASAPGGYRLLIAKDACDVDRFDRDVSEAERAAGDGDREGARQLLCSALSLWRGEPLAGVPGPHAESLRGALTERRLATVETRIRLELELGAHAETVPELTLLVAEHPLREGLRAQLMLGLYRSGRQAEALAAYADGRSVLATELGVAPGAELSDLHQRILRADPSLTAGLPPAAASSGPPSRASRASQTVRRAGRRPSPHATGTPHPPSSLRLRPTSRGARPQSGSCCPRSTPSPRTSWSPPCRASAASVRPRSPCTQVIASATATRTVSSTSIWAVWRPTPSNRTRSWAGSCVPSASDPSRMVSTNGPRSTARYSRGAGSWSSSTTRRTAGRSTRCCRTPLDARPW